MLFEVIFEVTFLEEVDILIKLIKKEKKTPEFTNKAERKHFIGRQVTHSSKSKINKHLMNSSQPFVL